MRSTIILLLSTALLLCLTPSIARADIDFWVNSNAASGPGSLREAIVEANSQSDDVVTISFGPDYPQNGTIQLLEELPTLVKRRVFILGGSKNPRLRPHEGSTTAILNFSHSVERIQIEKVRFEGGRSNSSGGCISAGRANFGDPVMYVSVTESQFIDCQAIAEDATNTGGGAIAIQNPFASMTVKNSLFSGNRVFNGVDGEASGSGGAISFAGEFLTILDSRFFSNQVEMLHASGGAIYSGLQLKQLTLRGNHFSNNHALGTTYSGHGGALSSPCFADCDIFMDNNFFSENQAAHGGAAFLRRGNVGDRIYVDMSNNTFHANKASDSAGALRLETGEVAMHFNTFEANRAPVGAHLAISTSLLSVISHNVLGHAIEGTGCQIDPSTAPSATTSHNAFIDASCAQKLQPGATLLTTTGPYEQNFSGAPPVIAYAADGPMTDTGADASDFRCHLLSDARGNSRPQDGNGDGISRCDIGAFERSDPWRIFSHGFEP